MLLMTVTEYAVAFCDKRWGRIFECNFGLKGLLNDMNLNLNLIIGRNDRYFLNILILSGDVESNPGPNPSPNPWNHRIMLLTQNCRGLNDFKKLKQILYSKSVAAPSSASKVAEILLGLYNKTFYGCN